jgi:2-desacetyl-2-hydroxyethyl bacteriochlorophyllide A dehydrogenase
MSLLGYGVPGAFAEYVSVPYFQLDTYAARLSDSLSYEVGATAEPLSVALYSVSRAQPKAGDTVVVIGLGIIGLCIIQVLKTLGITDIIVSGRRSMRLKLAKTAGADTIVDAAKDDIVPVVQEKTSGRGADIVFECAGTSDTFEQAFRMVHNGGKVALVGLYEQSITWNPSMIVSHDIDIIGCGLRFDLLGAMHLMTAGKVDTGPYITHQFPLEKIKEAFEIQLTADDAVKVLVKP